MEKLYFSRPVENSREPGNINVGLIKENDIVRLSVYSDAFYMSEVKQFKVSLKRQNEANAFEEKVITIDPTQEQLLETIELGIRNDSAYDIIISLPNGEENLDFLNEDNEVVKSIQLNVLVTEMLPLLERPMAFIAKVNGYNQDNVIDVFASKGIRLVLATEGFNGASQNQFLHKGIERKEVLGILFPKVSVKDTLDKGHIFLEVGSNGSIVTAYRRNYLIASLIASEANQEPEIISAVVDGKIMVDVNPLLETFNYDVAGGIPEQAMIKVGAGITDQTFAQSSVLETLLLEGMPYDKVNSSGFAGYEKPATEYALVMGATTDVGASAMVSLVKGDYARSSLIKLASKGAENGPKMKSFFRGEDLHVVVYGISDEVAVLVKGDKPLFKAKICTGEETHFIFDKSKSLIGKEVRAVLIKDGVTSSETIKVVKDIEELYPVFPTVSEILTNKTAASVSFLYTQDNRYAYARLFKDGVVVRDKIKGTKITMQALTPGTSYTFQLAFVDIEEYESARIPVSFETEAAEEVINYSKRLQLMVDDIEVTFKI